MSVRLELQADFLAGVWAHYAQNRGIVEPGDVEEALARPAPSAMIVCSAKGRATSCRTSFTHGTSAQRAGWFHKGLDTGDVRAGDTFNAE